MTIMLSKLTKKIFSSYSFKSHNRNVFKYDKTVIVGTIRESHTDIKVPDFSYYRRSSVLSPQSVTNKSECKRKSFSNAIVTTAAIFTLYGVKAEINRYVLFMAATADVIALSKIEIKLSEIPEGKNVTFKWRNKPLYVRHRSPEQIKTSKEVIVSSLRDPATDEQRCAKEKYLVVLGVCTHLGCVPIPDAGDFGPGGYYCPCHGAHFDGAGRVRKGPAPLNLIIPEHHYIGEDTLVVG